MVFLPLETAKAEAPEMTVQEMTIEGAIAHFSEVYGVDPKISIAVARCESNFNPNVIGDGGRAKGIYQYHNETWYRHYKEFNKETGITLVKGEPKDDAQLAIWAIANGKGSEWSSLRAIRNGGTYSFYSKLLEKNFTVKCSL